ncbi:hypothetical v2 protein [Passion fruit chlorotic mottle virus]|uniref:Hypothetical v2 protein n=1 Tax=Passion fruit chlorotic mottle virus TaxID=2162638 RepID=A0A2R4Q8U1_9GEMI|nr:hypothetical v2 protein [Passion fruit chlorotic mottle virus]AVY03268.1 hypothetical v2 protein [Passion fruit chlorotic mottle virus]
MSCAVPLDFGNLPDHVVGLLCMLAVRLLMMEEKRYVLEKRHSLANRHRILIRIIRKWGRKNRVKANGDYAEWKNLWASYGPDKEKISAHEKEASYGPSDWAVKKNCEADEKGKVRRDSGWM